MLMEKSKDSLYGLAPGEMARNLDIGTRVAVLSQVLHQDRAGTILWHTFNQNDGVVVGLSSPGSTQPKGPNDSQQFNVLFDEPILSGDADDGVEFPTTHPMVVDGHHRPMLHSELGPLMVRNIVVELPE